MSSVSSVPPTGRCCSGVCPHKYAAGSRIPFALSQWAGSGRCRFPGAGNSGCSGCFHYGACLNALYLPSMIKNILHCRQSNSRRERRRPSLIRRGSLMERPETPRIGTHIQLIPDAVAGSHNRFTSRVGKSFKGRLRNCCAMTLRNVWPER